MPPRAAFAAEVNQLAQWGANAAPAAIRVDTSQQGLDISSDPMPRAKYAAEQHFDHQLSLDYLVFNQALPMPRQLARDAFRLAGQHAHVTKVV